jgi:hypothetical protein
MTLFELGAIGELVGGIGIIVSLVYVGFQIRQSAQASRAETVQSFTAQYTEVMLHATEKDFRDIWWRGRSGLKHLKESEIVAFFAYFTAIMRIYEGFFFQEQDGSFDSRVFKSWMVQLTDIFSSEGLREFWEIRKRYFATEFIEFVETLIASGAARPLYPEEA